MTSWDEALAAGLSRRQIGANLKAGRWQGLHRGVYGTHNGPLSFSARVHAAVLATGRGAVASHYTAATLNGLVGQAPLTSVIHVSIPAGRRIATPSGVRIHTSGRLPAAAHPTRLPAQTRIEETVLDVIALPRRRSRRSVG